MKKLSNPKDIWEVGVTEEDIQEAIQYATVSLPWTFDRMGYGGNSQNGINMRLFHIRQGVLNQSILQRIMESKGHKCSKDWKHYRQSDVFDFSIGKKVYDVKTFQIISSLSSKLKREKFSKELLLKNKDYPGPEWRHFFPMMVALTQLNNNAKDGYIFGFSECWNDLRKLVPQMEDDGFWSAAPYEKAFTFFQTTQIIKERELAKKGFNVVIHFDRKQKVLFKSNMSVTIFGEWDGDRKEETLQLKENQKVISIGKFSALSCIKLEHPVSLTDTDEIIITVHNQFENFVEKKADPSINLNDANFKWIVKKDSFINLRVPKDYKVYWLGTIPVNEYYDNLRKYPAYFIPHPKKPNVNTSARLSPDAKEKFARLDRRRQNYLNKGQATDIPEFGPLIKGNKINAGIMIFGGGIRPLGAACYFYPPYALLEGAMYILPGDLYRLDDLK